jgi:peptidoglycan hydrolase-like protein with peptidoglycan-binding domain
LNRITGLSLPLSLLIISTAAVIPQFDTDLLAQTSVITPCDPNAQTLKKGDVTLQNLLVEKGYIDGDYVDGDFGPEAAVKQFQTDNGLTTDGIVGPTTWQALCSIAAPPSD